MMRSMDDTPFAQSACKILGCKWGAKITPLYRKRERLKRCVRDGGTSVVLRLVVKKVTFELVRRPKSTFVAGSFSLAFTFVNTPYLPRSSIRTLPSLTLTHQYQEHGTAGKSSHHRCHQNAHQHQNEVSSHPDSDMFRISNSRGRPAVPNST